MHMTTIEAHGRATTSATPADRRLAGAVMLAGAITMLGGAAAYFSAGADFWAAVDDGKMAALLTDAAAASERLYLAFSLWSFGALLLGSGGAWAARRRGVTSAGVEATFAIGAALATISFLVMASVVRLAVAGGSADIAEPLAFLGVRLDDLATVMLIGAGPALLATRDSSMPRWLVAWGLAAGVVGVVSLAAMFAGSAATVGFVVVPIGIGWTIAAGVVFVRRGSGQ